MAIYNTIGTEYNNTRRADPYIASRVYALLQANARGRYLDVGCGTGNYLHAFNSMGGHFHGVDPSEVMLQQAREKSPGAQIVQAKAEQLPFTDQEFDGATAMFTIHHWTDAVKGLREVQRVLKPGARLVMLSFTPKQMKGYWLNHYFPAMMKRSWELVPDIEGMHEVFYAAGLKPVMEENYFVQQDLRDHFLYSNKFRPEMYLQPEVRANISSFSAFAEANEVAHGLDRLKADIESGSITGVMSRYENKDGDYIFYVAEK